MRRAREALRAGRRELAAAEQAEGAWLLAIESATQVASVALLRGDAVAVELATCDARPHSERLLPLVDQALALAGVAIADVEAFAISAGPGSFTGLRIGFATLKGLAFGATARAAAVPTLAALAAAAQGAPGPVAALLDARRGEVYASVYAAAGDDAPLVPESVYAPAALARLLPPEATVVVGEGAAFALEALTVSRSDLHFVAPALGGASAARVGALGRRLLARGEGVDPRVISPRYVRRAEAEARRTGSALESFDTPEAVS